MDKACRGNGEVDANKRIVFVGDMSEPVARADDADGVCDARGNSLRLACVTFEAGDERRALF